MTTDFPGIPAQYIPLIPVLVGLIASFLVAPITALAKKLGDTQGVTTVTISAALSALIAGLGGWLAGAYGHGLPAFVAAVGASLTAFLRSNGSYVKGVQVATKAQEGSISPVVIVNPTSAAPLIVSPATVTLTAVPAPVSGIEVSQ